MDEQTGARVIEFHKSSYSTAVGSNCVEVGLDAEVTLTVCVRDSKDPEGGTLRFTPEEWRAFIAAVKDGEFDL